MEQSKTDNIKKANVFEKTQLFKVLQEKLRRNHLSEKQIAHKEALINSATRGVMTIFYKLSQNKADVIFPFNRIVFLTTISIAWT